MSTSLLSTFLAEHLILAVLAVPVLLGLFEPKKTGLCSAASALFAWIVGELFKTFFFTPRPFMIIAGLPTTTPLLNGSFPSNHAAVSFAIAFSVFPFHPRLGLLLLILSLGVGIGRVIVFAHFPVDVIGGVVIGLIVSGFSRKIIFKH